MTTIVNEVGTDQLEVVVLSGPAGPQGETGPVRADTKYADDYGDDGAAIQTAIDVASVAGTGRVYVEDGTWDVDNTIECAEGVDLILSSKAILNATADVDIIKVHRSMRFSGGKIDCSNVAGYSSNAILFDGALQFRPHQTRTIVSDMLIVAETNGVTGAGIKMNADANASDQVTGQHIQNVHIWNFGKGIWMRARSPSGVDLCWVNGNLLRDIAITGGQYAIHFDGGTVANCVIGANIIHGLFYQTTATSVTALSFTGRTRYNDIYGFQAFDWENTNPGGACINLGALSVYEKIRVGEYVFRDLNLVDSGSGNKVYFLRSLAEDFGPSGVLADQIQESTGGVGINLADNVGFGLTSAADKIDLPPDQAIRMRSNIGRPPYSIRTFEADFGGNPDDVCYWGYNVAAGRTRIDNSYAQIVQSFEANYYAGGRYYMEYNLDFIDPTGAVDQRYMALQIDRDDPTQRAGWTFWVDGDNGFYVKDAGDDSIIGRFDLNGDLWLKRNLLVGANGGVQSVSGYLNFRSATGENRFYYGNRQYLDIYNVDSLGIKLDSGGTSQFLGGNVQFGEGVNLIVGTTTGTKIGTATNQKLGFYNATPVVQPATLTPELTTITHTAPGTPDYAVQDLTQTNPWGFASHDEGNTVLSVIANLQARVNELESRLQSLGLLA